MVAEIIRDLEFRERQSVAAMGEDDGMTRIFIHRELGGQYHLHRGDVSERPATLPVVVSRGFAVFSGSRARFTRNLTTRFTMENTWQDGNRTLNVSFERHRRVGTMK